MLKKLLFFVTLVITFLSQAQTLYWVGGSGNWNDPQHWSLSSGGLPNNTAPTLNTHVVFDEKSSLNTFAINLVGLNYAKSLNCNTTQELHFTGSKFANLTCAGDFIFNDKVFYSSNSKLIFSNSTNTYRKIDFWRNKIDADVLFEKGNWEIKSLKLADNNKLSISSGSFIINNAYVVVGDLEINTGDVNLNTNRLSLHVKNKISIGANAKFNSTDLVLITQPKNSGLYNVSADVDFGINAKNVNPSPQACNVNYSFTNPICRFDCNATMTFIFDAGCNTGPYDIIFNTGATCIPTGTNGISSPTLTLNNLCSCGGNLLDFLVFDANGFVYANPVPVNMPADPPFLQINFISARTPNCFGQCNGSVNITASGPGAPYTIYVNPPTGQVINSVLSNVTNTVSGLCAGIQTFSIVSTGGCSRTFTTNLTQPAVLLANGSSSSVTCNGVCNGSATVNPTGGTSPYSYSWNPPVGATTSSVSNLCANTTASVTVTDSRTCTATYSVTINQPPAITLTVTQANLSCASVCNGSASIAASGGSNTGFTYAWSPNVSSSSSATGLCVGSYTVSVTDNLNCTKTTTFTITAPPTLTATPTQTNIACTGVCTASINLHPSGGTGAYTFSWSPAVSTSSIASNICAGPYSYTVTDAAACAFSNSLIITQPPAITLTVSKTDVTCNGACNGIAIANLSGGTSPYTYTWSPGIPTGQGTPTITALCPNTYTVNTRDFNGCARSSTTSITQPLIITANITTVSPTCNGLCNGSISSSPTGGTLPYTYTLQSSSGPSIVGTPPFNNLCAGSYTLIINDALGCVRTQIINLIQPNPITLSLNATPISCFGQCNSSISSIVTGGTPVYTFTWSNGSHATALTNQCIGVYTSTVSDAAGCRANASVTVTSAPDMTISVTPTNPNCNSQCTGIASASVLGGTPNYTITWSTGTIGNSISSLCQGNYTATVRDLSGCIKTQTVSITTPPALTLTPTNGTVTCSGTCNGTISVLATGGTSGYFYSWNTIPTQSTQSAIGLCPGSYVASVTDSKGCIASIGATVSQPAALTSSISNVQPSCNVCIGAATINGSGGTLPYTYNWIPSIQTGSVATNLCVGSHTAIITDNNGCTSTRTVQINQTVNILITSSGNTLTCHGGCTGVASSNASGGLPPYTYSWTPSGQTASTATALCAGTYSVLVRDANGCSNTSQVTFVDPPSINLIVNASNTSCNSVCNGSISATATGGTGLISYLWQPGGMTTSSVTNLCAGVYTVTATDASGCNQSQTVTITEPTSISAAFTSNNPTTCSTNDGSISFVLSGGTPAYTFTWVPGGGSNPLVNLGDGTYILNVRDANGCNQSYTTTLSDPIGPTVTVSSNSISCFGQCSGSATLSILSSTPTYSINWPGVPSTNSVVTNLCVGNYIAQVTDANSCITNQTVTITQPTQISSSGISTNVTCNSACSGSINLTPNGGTPPYSYNWLPSGGTGQDPTNLCANNYTVTISDFNSCTVTNFYTITQPSLLNITFNKKDVLCNGTCNGSVRGLVSGGTAPYSYTWSPLGSFSGSNLDTIINLCSGLYTFNVRDANGCIVSETVSINQPTALTSTITTINSKCNNQCNGSAIINSTGGTSPYTYLYTTSPSVSTQSVGGLCVGSYIGIVIDANGCSSSNGFTITQPLPITITTTVTNPLCNAACNGSVSTSVTGGNPNYHYSWIPSGGQVQNPTGLCAGNYTVIVTDDSLCTSQALVSLINPSILVANTSFTNPTCNNSCNGIVTANPTGGTGSYSYAWTTPANSNQTVTNLCAGIYTLIVTDTHSCQDTQTVILTDPPLISINPAVTPATCGFNDGSINAVASSGNPPYTYNWLPPVPLAQSTNTMVTAIGAGVYTVVVTDASLCTATISIPLSNSDGPSGATITSTNVVCNGQCNGAADISNPIGGTSPYILSWLSPVSTNSLITGLCAGSYTAQVQDANNCLLFQSVTILQPQSIDDNEILASAKCFGVCDGTITLNPTGGNGGYTYLWNNTATTQSITNLCPGNYSVTITDNQNCSLTSTYNLPSQILITANTFATDNSCFGNCNGTLLATNVAGSTPPYSYAWTDPSGQSTSLASNLCNGNYSVTINDNNGCSSTISGVINSPTQLTYTSSVIQPNCNLCNGSASITPTGGTPSYSLTWSNSQTGNNITGLCAGVYMVQIMDGNGCTSSSNITINNSSGITGETISYTDVSCASTCDGTVSISAIGGVAPITYHWIHNNSSSQNLSGLCAGTYFCNMIDANGCVKTASVVIGSAVTLSITSQIAQSSCTVNTGSISVNVAGGTGIYSYVWLPSGNTSSLTNLAPGNYTLTVTDGNGCSQTQQYAINSNNGPSITFIKNNITCSNVCDGNIAITITGGNPTYTTLWSNSASTNTISNLCAGNYSVEVTDASGCKAVQNFSLTTISPIVFSLPNLNNPLCANDCNGSITSIPSGGTLPYSYSWTPNSSSSTLASNLCPGNYSITVSDANGCPSSDSYTLTSPPSLTLTFNSKDVQCNNTCTGGIRAIVSGGVGAYTYSWTPVGAFSGSSSDTISNLCIGIYSVVVNDGNGCSIGGTVNISEPLAINDNESITDAACFGNCNGIINLNPSGGVGGYVYSWSNGATSATITNICPGTYSVTITDIQNCAYTATYNIASLTTITSSTFAVDNICFGNCNGVLTATNVLGGLPPYTYNWSDPLGQSTAQAIGLCNGNYSVTITDANGCYDIIPAIVSSPDQISYTPIITQPDCNLCNGSVILNPTGGTPTYSLSWSDGQSGISPSGLCAGIYMVQITDANGCSTNSNVIINNSSTITGETISLSDETCYSTCNGSVSITAIGGVSPITYHWLHNNSSSQTLTNLCSGTYFCNMIDANGCSRTASVVIGSAVTLSISSQVTQSSCTANTGSITVEVTGGTGVYTYAWLPAGSTSTITNLAPGTYTLNVSDGNGCPLTQVYSINSINGPVINFTKNDVSCTSNCDGAINLTVTGGVPGYSIAWSNGATTSTVNGLCVGSYSVLVADNVGCAAAQQISISNSSPIVFSLPNLNNPICNGDCNGILNALPSGGNLPYTYSWLPSGTNAPTSNSLCAGTHTVFVTDSKGCLAQQTYTLINHPVITFSAIVTDASCSTVPDGAIDFSTSGGVPNPGYSYNWVPGGYLTEDLTNVLAGTYSVSVTDFVGCKKDTSVTIISTIVVDAVTGNDTTFCINGVFNLDASNSIGGVSYQWLQLPTNTIVSNTTTASIFPSSGTSTYAIVATNGQCIDSDTIVINSNALPIVDAGPMISIAVNATGSIGGNPTGPSGSTFSWSPITTLDNITATNPTTSTTITTVYTVTVIDVNGCINFDTVTVYVYPKIIINNGFSPNADGKNDTWQIDNISQFPDCEVEIYNRWGELLFYSKGYSTSWNGQYKGKDLPVGTYYYIINLNHPEFPDAYTGPLTIFR